MSLRDDRDFEQAIHSSELQAENDRLRSQLEGCEERLRQIRDYGLKYEARSQHFKAIALLAMEGLGEDD